MNFTKAFAALTGLLQTVELIEQWIETKRQNAEMSPDEVAVWEAHKASRLAMPHWNRPENRPTSDDPSTTS